METDNVSRRCVVKSVGMITGSSVVGKRGGRRHRAGSTRTNEQPAGPTPEPRPQTAWPQFGGSAANRGYRRGIRGPQSGITFRWQIEVRSRLSGVVVENSTVYTSGERMLYALSAADGSTQWTIGGDHLRRVSAPAVGDGLVYVGCVSSPRGQKYANSTAFDSHVRAVDSTTGKERWRFEPNQPVAQFHPPTIADGIVYTVGRNVGGGTVGRLYALDSESGELLWVHETGRSGINGYDAPPVAVTDGVVYLAADKLVAIDGATGIMNWSVDPGGTYKAMGTNAPAIADGRLYVGRGTDTATRFEARSVTDGALVWEHTVKKNRSTQRTETEPLPGRWTTPAVVDGSVYVGFNERSPRTNRTSVITALRSDDGTVQWQQSFTDDRHTVHTPAMTEKTLYTGGTALTRADGIVRWRLDAPPTRQVDAFTPPAVADDTVYVGGASLRAITGLP